MGMFSEIAMQAMKDRILHELERALAEAVPEQEKGLLRAIEIVKDEPTD